MPVWRFAPLIKQRGSGVFFFLNPNKQTGVDSFGIILILADCLAFFNIAHFMKLFFKFRHKSIPLFSKPFSRCSKESLEKIPIQERVVDRAVLKDALQGAGGGGGFRLRWSKRLLAVKKANGCWAGPPAMPGDGLPSALVVVMDGRRRGREGGRHTSTGQRGPGYF